MLKIHYLPPKTKSSFYSYNIYLYVMLYCKWTNILYYLFLPGEPARLPLVLYLHFFLHSFHFFSHKSTIGGGIKYAVLHFYINF